MENDQEIQKLFNDLVVFFRSHPDYKIRGGGKTLLILGEPTIKMFIQSKEFTGNDPVIVIRKYA